MHIASITLLATYLVILLCSCGDCVRLRKPEKTTLKQTTTRRRIHGDQSLAQTPKKNRMKKYFADKLNPYLDELEDACIQLCVKEEENSEKQREILANQQQPTEPDSSDDDGVEIAAEEVLTHYTVDTEKMENVIELNVSESEETLTAESESVSNPNEETPLQAEHEIVENSQAHANIHGTDHTEPNQLDHHDEMEHNEKENTDDHHRSPVHADADHRDVEHYNDQHHGATDEEEEEEDNHELNDKTSEKPAPSSTSIYLWTISFIIFLVTVTAVALRFDAPHAH